MKLILLFAIVSRISFISSFRDESYEWRGNDVDQETRVEPKTSTPHWTYEDERYWADNFPGCAGRQQSPIDLDEAPSRSVFLTADMDPLYGFPRRFKMVNNGHSAQLSIINDGQPPPCMTFQGQKYTFEQMHFHWGPNDRRGSEHVIDGDRFPLEGHMVHYNARYKNVADALGKENGVLVLATLFKTSDLPNFRLNPLIRELRLIRKASSEVQLAEPFKLVAALPPVLTDVFVYQGSLTTPPCTEKITWVISKDVVRIGESQIAEFRKLLTEEGKPLRSNFRHLQNINRRTVLKSNFGNYYYNNYN